MDYERIPEAAYKEFHRSMPIACVDVLLISKSSFLLMKRKNAPARGKWWFPGGRILRNELLADAVRRKILEETGLQADKPTLLGVEETLFPDGPFGDSTHTINVLFRAETDQNDVVLDGQNDEYGWFEYIDKKWPKYIQEILNKNGFLYKK
jgi:colanic acid biosynthesis protein WcaH